MSAFLIVDIIVKNAAALEEYFKHAAPSLEKYGGTFLVQSEAIESIEGNWSPKTVIIVKFPDMATAKKWYSSEEYAPALAVKAQAFNRSMVLIPGID